MNPPQFCGLDHPPPPRRGRKAATLTEEPLTFADWKRLSQQVLETYLHQRLFVTEEEEKEEESDDDDESETPSTGKQQQQRQQNPQAPQEDEEESPEWETQGFAMQQETEKGVDAAPPRPPRPPHIDEAIHTVNYLSDVNLYTQKAKLDLLRVERVFPGRKTLRSATSHAFPRQQALIPVHQGPLKVPLEPCLDDGPLACIYKHVLSFDVTQLNQPKSTLRLKAAAAMQPSLAAIRRMQIFLYNDYAEALQRLFDKHKIQDDSGDLWLLSLPAVPARCIFPLPPPSWTQADLAAYALTIGDRSIMKVTVEEDGVEVQSPLRFDAVVRVGLVRDGHVAEEWELVAPDSNSEVETRTSQDGVMASLWETHRPAVVIRPVAVPAEGRGNPTARPVRDKSPPAPTTVVRQAPVPMDTSSDNEKDTNVERPHEGKDRRKDKSSSEPTVAAPNRDATTALVTAADLNINEDRPKDASQASTDTADSVTQDPMTEMAMEVDTPLEPAADAGLAESTVEDTNRSTREVASTNTETEPPPVVEKGSYPLQGNDTARESATTETQPTSMEETINPSQERRDVEDQSTVRESPTTETQPPAMEETTVPAETAPEATSTKHRLPGMEEANPREEAEDTEGPETTAESPTTETQLPSVEEANPREDAMDTEGHETATEARTIETHLRPLEETNPREETNDAERQETTAESTTTESQPPPVDKTTFPLEGARNTHHKEVSEEEARATEDATTREPQLDPVEQNNTRQERTNDTQNPETSQEQEKTNQVETEQTVEIDEGQDGSDVENAHRDETPPTTEPTTTAAPLSPVNGRRAQAFRIVQPEGRAGSPSRVSSPSRDKDKEELHYHKLGELRAYLDSHNALSMGERVTSPCVVNVIALVLGFGCPSLTKRGEWMMGVALVDDSIPLDSESTDDSVVVVNVNIFAKDKSYLPTIRYAGDVLRLHRVRLQEWRGDIQLMGVRPSSYVVCRKEIAGESGTADDWTLVPTSKSSISVSDTQKKKITNLWEWGQRRLENFPTMKASKSYNLSEVHSDQNELYSEEDSRDRDLTVMVTSIFPRQSEISHHPIGFLRVWDGTGVPASDPLVSFNPAAVESIADGDPPAQALTHLASLIKKLQTRRAYQTPLMEPEAVTGRVVNVAIWETPHWELVQQVVKIGTFIRLRNVQDNKMPDSGLRCLMVHSKSYLTPLPDLTFEVVKMLENHNGRLARKEEMNPRSGLLPIDSDEEDTAEMPSKRASTPRTRSPSPRRHSPKRRKVVASSQEDFSSLLSTTLPTKFTGIVNITGTIPAFPVLASGGMEKIVSAKHNFAVKLEDGELNQVDAIVNGKSPAAASILGGEATHSGSQVEFATSFLRTAIKKRWEWIAEIRSIVIDGAKYFVLEGIQKCEVESVVV